MKEEKTRDKKKTGTPKPPGEGAPKIILTIRIDDMTARVYHKKGLMN